MYPHWLLLTLRAFVAALSLASPRRAGRLALRLFCTPRRHHRPGWESHLARAARRLTVGPRLAAWSFDPEPGAARPAAPAVLLLHGWEGRGTQLGRFADPLVREGYRVIAIDLPAHGESPGSMTDLIECTESLRKAGRELGPLAAVIAHSFGGAVATLALERGLDVASVVLIATPSSVEDVIRRFGDLVGLRGAAMHAFRDALERQTGVTLADVEIFERAARLTTPALIVHDRDDREVPFHDAERLAARWPGAMLHATEGLGHRRILRDDGVIRRVVAFVGAAAPASR